MRIPISIVLNGKRTFNIIHVRERRRNAGGQKTTKRWNATGGGFTTMREGHRHVYVVLDEFWDQMEIFSEGSPVKFDRFIEHLCSVIDHEVVHYVEPQKAPHCLSVLFEFVAAEVRGWEVDWNLIGEYA